MSLGDGVTSRDDHRTARELALAAGELLLTLRAAQAMGDPDELRRAGDRRSNDFILGELRDRCAGDHILSEEAPDDLARVDAARVWIVDPLDGTREFGEIGRTDWAVHVALLVDGHLAAGAVALPARGQVFCTDDPPAPVRYADRVPRIAVSRTRPGPLAAELARRLDGTLEPMGSAGVKAMAVLTGDADIYAHSGGQYVWDSAAPVAVAMTAGLHASRLDGSALVYDAASTWLPDLLICRPELSERVLKVVAEVTA